jgi:hypothetical protein
MSESDGCGCEAVVAEGLGTNIVILLHRVHRDAFTTVARRPPLSVGGSHLLPLGRKRDLLRSDHALLVESLKVSDHLGDYSDQLTGDVRDILLGQLPLLSPGGRSAKRRLELRHAKLRPEILHRITLPELTQALLPQALLPQALAALHGSILQLRLVLQHSDDLWHDLPHHFVDILLAQRARRLAVSGVSDRRVLWLCLSQDLR